MVAIFKRKPRPSKEVLEERYNKILSEVLEFTTRKGIVSDKRLDRKLVEAQKVFHQLSKL